MDAKGHSVFEQVTSMQQRMYLDNEDQVQKEGVQFVSKNNQNFFNLKFQKIKNKIASDTFNYQDLLVDKFIDNSFPPVIYSLREIDSETGDLDFLQWKRVSNIFGQTVDFIFKPFEISFEENFRSNPFLLLIFSVLHQVENFNFNNFSYDQEKGVVSMKCITDHTSMEMDDFIPVQMLNFQEANYSEFTYPFIEPSVANHTVNLFYTFLEKYAAKIFGSYEALQKASLLQVFKLFSYDLQEYNLKDIQKESLQK